MSTVLASALSNTPVMRSDGKNIGTVDAITMAVETGELLNVLVTPRRRRDLRVRDDRPRSTPRPGGSRLERRRLRDDRAYPTRSPMPAASRPEVRLDSRRTRTGRYANRRRRSNRRKRSSRRQRSNRRRRFPASRSCHACSRSSTTRSETVVQDGPSPAVALGLRDGLPAYRLGDSGLPKTWPDRPRRGPRVATDPASKERRRRGPMTGGYLLIGKINCPSSKTSLLD